jgi:hypothetical protein
VHGVLLGVTSNVLMSELAACTDEDREWLTGNSHVLEVTEPLAAERLTQHIVVCEEDGISAALVPGSTGGRIEVT